MPVEGQRRREGGGSPCRMCALTATDTRLKTTSGGSVVDTERRMQLVVCGVRRPVQLEGPEQNPGHTREHGPTRSKSVSSTRCAARSLRLLDQCAQVLGKLPEIW